MNVLKLELKCEILLPQDRTGEPGVILLYIYYFIYLFSH